MKPAQFPIRFAWLTVAGLVLAACVNQMEPARQALGSIDSVLGAAAPEAGKYIPDQLASVQGRLADLKSAFESKDYRTVIAGAPAVLTAAQGLASAAAAKKDEVMRTLAADWTTLSASLPGLVSAVKNRVDALARVARPPAGVDLAAAQAALADATAGWSAAQAAAAGGNLEEAVKLARKASEQVTAGALALKLTLPAQS